MTLVCIASATALYRSKCTKIVSIAHPVVALKPRADLGVPSRFPLGRADSRQFVPFRGLISRGYRLFLLSSTGGEIIRSDHFKRAGWCRTPKNIELLSTDSPQHHARRVHLFLRDIVNRNPRTSVLAGNTRESTE